MRAVEILFVFVVSGCIESTISRRGVVPGIPATIGIRVRDK